MSSTARFIWRSLTAVLVSIVVAWVPTAFAVSPDPYIQLDSTEVPAGASTGVHGGDFEKCATSTEAGRIVLRLGHDVVAEADVDHIAGEFGTDLSVPADTPPGAHTVTARCATNSKIRASTAITVLPHPQADPTLALSPSKGAPETPVTATGSDFNCQLVDLVWDDDTALTEAAVSGGSFTEEFDVPESATPATYTVRAECRTDPATYSEDAFKVTKESRGGAVGGSDEDEDPDGSDEDDGGSDGSDEDEDSDGSDEDDGGSDGSDEDDGGSDGSDEDEDPDGSDDDGGGSDGSDGDDGGSDESDGDEDSDGSDDDGGGSDGSDDGGGSDGSDEDDGGGSDGSDDGGGTGNDDSGGAGDDDGGTGGDDGDGTDGTDGGGAGGTGAEGGDTPTPVGWVVGPSVFGAALLLAGAFSLLNHRHRGPRWVREHIRAALRPGTGGAGLLERRGGGSEDGDCAVRFEPHTDPGHQNLD